MLTVGNLLKKAREHLGKDIKEIAQSLRIKPQYLEQIENNQFSGFESSTYVKGFIRSYASYLGLDAESIVALFRRQIGEEEKPLKVKNQLIHRNSVVVSPVAIMSAIVVFFFIALFSFLIYQFYNLQQPPSLNITAPAEANSTTDSPAIEIKGATETNTIVTINNAQIQVRDDATFIYAVELKEGVNTYKIEAWKKNIEGKRAEKIILITYKPKTKTTEAETENTNTDSEQNTVTEKHKINISLSSDVWLQLVADNVQQAVGIKKKGYSHNFEATKSLEISSGKPNSSTVTIDGKIQTWSINKKGTGSISCNTESGEWKCN